MRKSANRPPTRKHDRKSTPPVPTVSLGTEYKRLLIHMSKVKRINVNGYSDNRKIARSTTRSRLKVLGRLGLIIDEGANKRINEKGNIYLENTNQIEKKGDESSRQGGRENDLSVHWHQFAMKIKDRKNFREERLNYLNCTHVENQMNNWKQIIAKFDDATIIINPNELRVHLYDLVKKDSDEVDAICFRRLIDYVELFKSIGVITEGVSIEKGHWARIESALSKFLYEKVDEKYYLELSDGTKFWIDNSPDKNGNRKREGETNDKQFGKNIDNAMTQMGLGEVDLDDINKIKESLYLVDNSLKRITTMETVRLNHHIEENKLKRLELEKTPQIEQTTKFTPGYIQ